jgi:hypothetical protein
MAALTGSLNSSQRVVQEEAARISETREASGVYLWSHKTCLMTHAQCDFTGG